MANYEPHLRTGGEQSCEGCTHLQGCLAEDGGSIVTVCYCPVRDICMDDPQTVARCPDWTDRRVEICVVDGGSDEDERDHREGEYVTCTIDRLSGGRYIAVDGDSDGNPPEFNHRMAAQAYPSAGLADARALDDMLNCARVHHVKISNYWADAHGTGKCWEIRSNDRDYEVGDRLVMHAADGRVISTKVLHVWWSDVALADLGLCIAAG